MLEKLLEKYIGEEIEIHYILLDESIIEKAILKFPPSKESVYVGNETGYHLIYWNKKHDDGKISGVRLIKNNRGDEIYRNDEIPFDYNNLKNPKKCEKSIEI